MVAPVTDAGVTHKDVFLPGFPRTQWYDHHTHEHVTLDTAGAAATSHRTVRRVAPLGDINVLQRGGTVVARRERARRSSALMQHDAYTLVVAGDRDGKAVGTLYADDGASYAHTKGAFLSVAFALDGDTLTATPTHVSSAYANDNVVERIVLMGVANAAQVTGAVLTAKGGGEAVDVGVKLVDGVLTLRKPQARISGEWSVQLQRSKK
jgi:alpha 1,3-glucosidase